MMSIFRVNFTGPNFLEEVILSNFVLRGIKLQTTYIPFVRLCYVKKIQGIFKLLQKALNERVYMGRTKACLFKDCGLTISCGTGFGNSMTGIGTLFACNSFILELLHKYPSYIDAVCLIGI